MFWCWLMLFFICVIFCLVCPIQWPQQKIYLVVYSRNKVEFARSIPTINPLNFLTFWSWFSLSPLDLNVTQQHYSPCFPIFNWLCADCLSLVYPFFPTGLGTTQGFSVYLLNWIYFLGSTHLLGITTVISIRLNKWLCVKRHAPAVISIQSIQCSFLE